MSNSDFNPFLNRCLPHVQIYPDPTEQKEQKITTSTFLFKPTCLLGVLGRAITAQGDRIPAEGARSRTARGPSFAFERADGSKPLAFGRGAREMSGKKNGQKKFKDAGYNGNQNGYFISKNDGNIMEDVTCLVQLR